ncbi:MAG: phosphoenolpyruvate carboxykinase (GTP) [Candidatus Omnitrophica bacterium]|nr:phosphoenolpyruvate carboxykinase (GTP) [Candidatus Omnitrophota bacterium]
MLEKTLESIKAKFDEINFKKLIAITYPKVLSFIAEAVLLCNPKDVFICSDTEEEIDYIRRMAIKSGEEKPLRIKGHTYHFDGYYDQGRDRDVTKFLVPKNDHLSPTIAQIERQKGLAEVKSLLKDSMKDKTLIVRFLTLGPANSIFSILCMECTDSWYVAHSVDLLYRQGYKEFLKARPDTEIFITLHSAGRLDKNMTSIDYDKKRIYIDYIKNTVYSVNTQYAGNSIGFKKLALRLAIRKAHREGWLAEHFMIIGVKGPKKRKTYLAGAFPSACGKTSTAMLPSETILADDIAYVRNIQGICRAVNVEKGIFGIIHDINPKDDPLIYKVLTSPAEVIFSNVLVKDKRPYWLGMGKELPKEGINFSGNWYEQKRDEKGELILPAHKNARYTVSLKALDNCDPALDDPRGVELGGIMFGGRDYRAYVPVQEGLSWEHGIIAYGACLETETTFAIVGQEGRYEINIMSIQDFISISLGKYLKNYLEFVKSLKKTPRVFGVNYFLTNLKTNKFLNSRQDKHIWIKWIELRIHNDVEATPTPTGLIPKYKDLKRLFKRVLNKDYTEDSYLEQFTLRVNENLAKLQRVEGFFRKNIPDAPKPLFEVIQQQRERLLKAKKEFGDYISPLVFEKKLKLHKP